MACSENILGFHIVGDECVVGDGALSLLRHFVKQDSYVGQTIWPEEGEGDGVVGEEAEAEEEAMEG